MSQKLSKRAQQIEKNVERDRLYTPSEAVSVLKAWPQVKFKESVDVVVVLGIDTRKSEQSVRGAVTLPHGLGREVRIAVFAEGADAKAAKAAGADRVGYEDLVPEFEKGKIDFDVIIATPGAMKIVGKLARILGPRGLMPNPKVGTVSTDVAGAVKNAKAGQARYRADKGGIIHCSIGKVDFDDKALEENFQALITDLKKAKPEGVKGVYFKKVFLSTTMGSGLKIDIAAL